MGVGTRGSAVIGEAESNVRLLEEGVLQLLEKLPVGCSDLRQSDGQYFNVFSISYSTYYKLTLLFSSKFV